MTKKFMTKTARKIQQAALFLTTLAPLITAAPAQSGGTAQPVYVSPDEAAAHLIYRVTPVYPPIARIAHVQGAVELHASVLKDGSVGDLTLISGPPMLVQPAMDAVKQWRYKPCLRDGEPVDVPMRITVVYRLADNDPEATTFSRWRKKCEDLIATGQYSEAEAACITAIDTSEKLPANDSLSRRLAYGDEAQALLGMHEFAAALDYARRELELARQDSEPDSFPLAKAHYNLARSFHGFGDMKQARVHYQLAERLFKHAMKGADQQQRQTVQSFLRDYAGFLRQSGDDSAAKKTGRKAASLALVR